MKTPEQQSELKAWISARDLQDFKDYQDEARNSSFSISTFKTLNDDVQITISTRHASAADLVEKAKAEWKRLKAIEHQPCSGIYYRVQAMEHVIKFLEAEVGK